MEIMFDNVNLATLEESAAIYPYVGVTSNPTIIKEEGKIDFAKHFNRVREIIGYDKSLHIQVVSTTEKEIIAEAHTIAELVDKNVYIKIPVTEEGLKAIKKLKAEGFKITATAIYTRIQGLLAIAAGVDYIAPYFNRIEACGEEDPCNVIACLRKDIDFTNAKTKILAASFHRGEQVLKALASGADAVTLQPRLLKEMISRDYITNAVNTFASDWENTQGCKNILGVK